MVKAKDKKGSGLAESFHKRKLNAGTNDQVWFLNKGFPLLWFAIAAFILFGQSISFNYTYLDDQTLIMNSMDRLRSPANLSKAFSEDVFHTPSGHGFYYRPMLTLSFMADAMIGKSSFAMFHFSSILYHILATFLLFLLFVELGYDRIRSLLFCLIFLAHPLMAQAVAWVPGRNDTLMAIFIFGSFIFWLKFLKSGSNLYLLLHLLLFFIALLTKESAIVLPVLIVFYSAVLLRAPMKKYSVAAMGWIIMAIIWAIVRYQALGGANDISLSAQLLSVIKNLPATLPFLGKALFPFNLSVYPILPDMKVSAILGAIAIGVLTLLILLTKPKQWFHYLFGLLWFLAFLVPSFVTINTDTPNFSEHRAYLSLMGILLIIMECALVKNANFFRPIPALILAGVILFFSALTFIHSRYFRDNFIFWQNAVETSPTHAFNYNNLGAMYFLTGDMEKAEPLFRKALLLNPYEPMANSNTGLVCMNTNRPAEAEKYYLAEIQINPLYDNVYYNLGLLYYNHARYDEGILQWEKILTINPYYTDAYKALLFAYEKLGRQGDYGRIAMKAKENGVLP